MLAIKLKRVGKKHQATFRVIVAEKRLKINGRFVEDLGWMNPHTNTFEIKNDLAKKCSFTERCLLNLFIMGDVGNFS